MAFWGAEKEERERMVLSWWSWRLDGGWAGELDEVGGRGIDTDLSTLSSLSLTFRNPSFLPMTFMAKEATGNVGEGGRGPSL